MEKKIFFAGGKNFFLRTSFLLFLILLMPPCEISHVFIFSKIFFHQVLEIFMRLCHFQPKHAIFFIFYILNIRLFWRKYFGHENRKKTIEIPFIILSISTPCRQANTNIDSPLQARSPRRGPSRVANQSLEVRCSSIIFPPNPKMVYLVLGGSTPIENPS